MPSLPRRAEGGAVDIKHGQASISPDHPRLQSEDAKPPVGAAEGNYMWSALAVTPGTAYNAALVFAGTYFTNLCIDDFRDDGSISILHWSFLGRCFRPNVLLNLFVLWGACHVCLVLGNIGLRCWRRGRSCFADGTGRNVSLWDWGWLSATVLLNTAMVLGPAWISYLVDLPASATCALCFEQVRLLMKSISYTSEHVRGILEGKQTDDSIGHLMYYLFAPTLIYRDSYERIPRIRVLVAVRHAFLFLVTLLTMVVAAGRGALRPFCGQDSSLLNTWRGGDTTDTASSLLRFAFRLALVILRAVPAGCVLAVGTSLALHSWNSVFAELLRFRARGFTRAWWNAPSYKLFFYDWNLFVKAWLKKYVYAEMLALGCGRTTARMITVTVSAIWHEYILAVSLGYIIPYCAVTYICSAAMVFPDPFRIQRTARGNLFVLLTLSGGIASFLAFYFTESTARIHCPQTLSQPWDLFVPRSFVCESPFRNCTFM